jgi:hypothetical protein
MISEADRERAWKHVGRFMWRFAIVESSVGELLAKLLNLNAAACLILLNKLDFSKKVGLVRIGLQSQGIDTHMISQLRRFGDVRNVLAHNGFTDDGDSLYLDYVNQAGKMNLDFRKNGDRRDMNTNLEYTELDDYDREMEKVTATLEATIAACKPIFALDAELAKAIAEEIDAAENVIPFRGWREPED